MTTAEIKNKAAKIDQVIRDEYQKHGRSVEKVLWVGHVIEPIQTMLPGSLRIEILLSNGKKQSIERVPRPVVDDFPSGTRASRLTSIINDLAAQKFISACFLTYKQTDSIFEGRN